MTAVDFDTYGPFDAGAGANVMESTWRKMMKHMTRGRSGVLKGEGSDCLVFGDSSGMQIKVSAGEVWIRGHWGEVTSTKTVAIPAAHATLSRIDRVVARADFSDNNIELDVVQGTAASSPTAPAVTQDSSIWEVSLATVSVPAADTSIGSNQVTDNRFYANFVGARYYNTVAETMSNASMTKMDFPTAEVACGDIVQVANDTFQLNLSGWWHLDASIRFEGNGTGYRQVIISANASSLDSGDDWFSSEKIPGATGAPAACSVAGTKYVTSGTQVCVGAFQNRGGSMVTDPNHKGVYFAMTWMGP
jgi:hypothetical protein